MKARHNECLLVEDAIEDAQYRVYPETPLGEVVDLMVRRDLRAVPVVGERYEVLGIITTGDALDQILRDAPAEESEGRGSREMLTARDVMTRAVLCVSETQHLVDAARMMVSKKVDQLPVVRDGELIGLITRDAILSTLHAGSRTVDTEPKDVS